MKRFFILGQMIVYSLMLMATTALAQDPLEVAPDMYKLLLENDRVRVMEVSFKPGEKIDTHSHPDHVAYIASGGTLSITEQGKEPQDIVATDGQVLWLDAQTHSAVNVGQTDIKIVVVELKEPRPTAEK